MRTARPGEVNFEPIDHWTWGHAAVGAGANALGAPFWATALFAVGWELFERPVRIRAVAQSIAPESYAGQDTAENALWDAMFTMVGWGAVEVVKRGRQRRLRRLR